MEEALAARYTYQPDGRLINKLTNDFGDKDVNRAGYRRVSWDRGPKGRVRAFAHRIVWVIHNGPILDGLYVDHIDGDFLNNRIDNLRLVTKSGNAQNSIRAGHWLDIRSGKHRAQIKIDGKAYDLGLHESPEAARAAYIGAKYALHEYATKRTLLGELYNGRYSICTKLDQTALGWPSVGC